MNFTREPIVETVIIPKEGFKLVVRNSKGEGQEEFYVDALEIVTFGHTSFFRSTDQSKFFLVPASDYEVLETREVKMVLKSAAIERNIKIAGGRETTMRVAKEERDDEDSHDGEHHKRKERRRSRKKRGKESDEHEAKEVTEARIDESGEEVAEETPMPIKEVRRTLIPPPSTLIHETIRKKPEPEEEEEVGFPGHFLDDSSAGQKVFLNDEEEEELPF